VPQFLPKLPNLGARPPEDVPSEPGQPAATEPKGPETAWRVDPREAARDEADLLAANTDKAVRAAPAPDAAARARAGAEAVVVRMGNAARQSDAARVRLLRGTRRPFLHMPTLTVPSRTAVEMAARELLSAPVEAARSRLQNPRELSDRIAMGRAIWRDLVIGFAAQLGELNLGFTQLAALYALEDSGTMTVADLADTLGRSPSTVSRLANGLVQRQLIERSQDSEDRRQRTLRLTGRGQALLGLVDRARAQEFLSIVRPLPAAERAVVAMGVAALSTHAISRRGRLIKQRVR
jgi:DNA-binding MarR family transcriptional regulator